MVRKLLISELERSMPLSETIVLELETKHSLDIFRLWKVSSEQCRLSEW